MEDWLVMAFDSTQQALRSETLMEYMELEFDLFPTPKSITAGCALSIQFPSELLERVVHMVRQEKVEIRGIYKLEDEVYQAIKLEEV
ncbi:DUF3343 domain-containing protein [Paenibacillus physcomitrellae]|uniref:Putative Se/S carrier protein-like domain-containing protein n=1 Tax=Paenibacillus physcomitrellae TaxID=1619311 RepID=A0ABQ1GNM1_9BACL|nr:DUF3343 domain-containing protein [Paenibacillus physcomitrellae]GGA47282.1 hypothetical protein GCM10010917_35710 [Paenibacillus physcomitrellae]